MALVKCPDCGKMVSPRASSCPDCGCPARFFVSDSPSNSEKKDVVAKTEYDSKIVDNTTTQVESIKYSILGNDIICYKGDYETLAKYCGYFYNLAENAEKKLIIEYYKCTNIEKALIDVPKLAKDIMSNAIDVAMGVFYDMGLTMSVEQFLEKYYYSNNMDYDTYYDKVVENYSEIVELRDNLKEYRALQKVNRGKWQGGGFGVKGAIKGAVTASMLNGASSFFHSFGDAMRKYSDDKKIKNALKVLYEDDNTKIELCCSIKQCIMNVY